MLMKVQIPVDMASVYACTQGNIINIALVSKGQLLI